MLFISRWVGEGTDVEVIDTDSGMTERYTLYSILHAVRDFGLNIQGFHLTDKAMWEHPYQPPEEKTQLQLKMKMIHSIDIEVYQSAISSIRWNPDKIALPVRIRLSDFGKSCHDFVLRGDDDRLLDKPCIILVFDDKLDLLPKYSITPVIHPNYSIHSDVRYDLTEVSNGELAMSIYKSLLVSNEYQDRSLTPDPRVLLQCVTDYPERISAVFQSLIYGDL